MNSSSDTQDLRIRRTHKLLWDALIALMSEQDYETITVKAICDRAMVHRTTFYKHYEDKNSLFIKGMSEMHKELFGRMKAEADEEKDEYFPMHFSLILEHVAAHKDFYATVLCGDRIGTFYLLMRDYLVERFEKRLQKFQKAGTTFEVPIELIAQFCAGTILSTITWWLENDQPISTEQMALDIRHLLLNGCQPIHS